MTDLLQFTVNVHPDGEEIFRTCPDRPWSPPSLLYNGYRVFPGGKEWPGRDADPSPPSSTMVMKEYILPLWAVRPVQSLSACTCVLYNKYSKTPPLTSVHFAIRM